MKTVSEQLQSRLPRTRRQLSHFFANELLYEYVHGRLDADRVLAIENQLREDKDLQHELQAMRVAETYLNQLAQTKISPHHLSVLLRYQMPAEQLLRKLFYRNWPRFFRWTTEAFLVSLAVAAMALFIPWSELSDKAFRFSQEGISWTAKNKMQTPRDESSVIIAEPVPVVDVGQKALLTVQNKKNEATISEGTQAKSTETNEPVAAHATSESDTDSVGAESAAQSPESKPAGFVYSMMMNLDANLEKTQEIRSLILQLGGAKAGQVELGWRKVSPPGSYYHFSLPEKNYDELVKTLGGYGRVRIYKNPHQRVMPEGQIRIILWIEDNPAQAPQENETENQ